MFSKIVFTLAVIAGLTLNLKGESVSIAQWKRSMDICFSGYRGSSSLTDFPVLIKLNPAAVSGFSYADCAEDGADLRFTDAENTSLLNHEVESWDTNGTSTVWVRVPQLYSNCVIKVFWNNPNALNISTGTTWNTGFRGVWHLNSVFDDATLYENNAVNSGTELGDGKIAGCRVFDGTDFLDCGNDSSLNIATDQLTLSAWIKPDTISGNAIVSKSYAESHTSPYYAWVLYTVSSGLHCRIDSTAATKGSLTAGVWQYVAATYNGSLISFYINGEFRGSISKSGNLLSTPRNVRIGGRDTSTLAEFFNGMIDEVRISAIARPADWIEAEYDTVAADNFCVFSEVRDNSIPVISIEDTQCVEGDSVNTQLVFKINLSVPATNTVGLHYVSSFGSAGTDDLSVIEGCLSIPVGVVLTNLYIEVNGDVADEPDETVFMDISEVTGAVVEKSRAFGLILDDDGVNPLSPSSVAADDVRKRVYVARHTDESIAVIDAGEDCLIQAFVIPKNPNGINLNADGSLIYAAAGTTNGSVYVLDSVTGEILQTIEAGHTPVSPCLSPDENRLYVCNRYDNDVSVINLADGSTVVRIPVQRQPVTSALTSDGSTLFVAEYLPTGPSTNACSAAAVNVIDTVAQCVIKRIILPPGAQSVRGMCISADGSTLYVTHIVSHFQIPTTQVLRGWMNTSALTLIDVAENEIVDTVLLDDLDLGAANPCGVICSADNRYLCITHAGTHEVSVIDQSGLLSALNSSDTEPSRDFTFLVDLRRRIPLKGNGPQGLALIGNRLFVAEYYSDSIGVVNILPGNEYSAINIDAGVPRIPDAVRRGERNYNDATLCLQQWQSCASCHPDARSDGLNWDLLNDGFGNPKNSKSHLYSIQTPPAMVTGIRASSQVAVRAGLKYIQFVNRDESYAEDIDSYLTFLEPLPSPYLVNGALSAAATLGKSIFSEQGCAFCHTGDYFTDQQKHNVGSGIGENEGVAFDTPTLCELWRTGPYLHDGRLDSVRNVVTEIHGSRVEGLSDTEIDELVEYLLSL